MMTEALLSGTVCELLFVLLVSFFKRADQECGYPYPDFKWIILSFFAGMVPGCYGSRLFGVVFAFLVFEAYTDSYTRMLYSLAAVIFAIAGGVALFFCGGLGMLLQVMLFDLPFLILLLFYRAFRAINRGDVELLAALSICMSVYGIHRSGTAGIYVSRIPFTILCIASLAAAIHTLGGKREKTVAFAPYILLSALITFGYI